MFLLVFYRILYYITLQLPELVAELVISSVH